MSYTHFTIAERSKIETLLELGFSIRRIAHKLGRAPSSISRELKRNPNYTCEKAQERYVQKKAMCGAKIKLTPKNKEVIQEKLNDTWSPEQIVGRVLAAIVNVGSVFAVVSLVPGLDRIGGLILRGVISKSLDTSRGIIIRFKKYNGASEGINGYYWAITSVRKQ